MIIPILSCNIQLKWVVVRSQHLGGLQGVMSLIYMYTPVPGPANLSVQHDVILSEHLSRLRVHSELVRVEGVGGYVVGHVVSIEVGGTHSVDHESYRNQSAASVAVR